MRYVAIVDTETTGLDEKAECVEAGCILFDVLYGVPVRSYASLIQCSHNEAAHINRIQPGALADAPAAEMVWGSVARLCAKAEAFLAHRAEFDRRFVPLSVTASVSGQRPWICTKFDLDWPDAGGNPHLVHIALSLGLGVATAHRALADCDLIARSLARMKETGHDLDAFLMRGLRPKSMFIAEVSYDDRDKAKAAGFQWDNVTRQWMRRMAKEDAIALAHSASFRVTEMTGGLLY
jgi:DNA polymerase-3 subunit epsilon